MTEIVNRIVLRPGSSASVNEFQARALFEFMHCEGIVCPASVGSGKTLVSLCAPVIVRARRPLLLTKAGLIKKTERDMMRYARDFSIANWLRIMSYEILGRVDHAEDLEAYLPDLVICDECQAIRNRKAAVTRRFLRFAAKYPQTRFIFMSGTLMESSVLDFAHMLWLALRHAAPIPSLQHFTDLKDWSWALDRRRDDQKTLAPGALWALCSDEEKKQANGHRLGFRRRLSETPGVIAADTDDVKCSLYLTFEHLSLSTYVVNALSEMRLKRETPNGERFESGPDLFRHVREMALGFYYHWDPYAPEAWLEKRTIWAEACSEILRHNHRGLDSPLAVANAIDKGFYPSAEEALRDWRAIKDTFKPNNVAAWLSYEVVDYIAERAAREKMLVWVDQVAFGAELSRRSGMPYYANLGVDAKTGRDIETDDGQGSVILSVHSNREGRNLQDRWSKMMVVNQVPNAQRLEQSIGRIHRPGQMADEVVVYFLITCPEHEGSIREAKQKAAAIEQNTPGAKQKILHGDWL